MDRHRQLLEHAAMLLDTVKKPDLARAVEDAYEESIDLKHQLSKSIEREQEIERELEVCRADYKELEAEFEDTHSEHIDAWQKWQEERARADALAGALARILVSNAGDYIEPPLYEKADTALTEYSQARE